MHTVRIALMLLFAVLAAEASAQVKGWHKPPYTQADTELVLSLRMRGFKLAYTNIDSALWLARESMSISKQLNYHIGLAKGANVAGIVFDVSGNADSAEFHYRNALRIARQHKLANAEAMIRNNLGLLAWNMFNLDSAVVHYSAASSIFKQTQDKSGLASTWNNMGLVYLDQDLPENGLSYFRDALGLYKTLEDERNIGATYNNLGLAFEMLEQADSAFRYMWRAMRLQEKTNDLYGLSRNLHNLSGYYRDHNEIDSALTFGLRAWDIKHRINDRYGIASTGLEISRLYYAYVGDSTKMKPYLEKAETIAREDGYKELLNKILYQKAKHLFTARKLHRAYDALEESLSLRDSIRAKQKQEALLTLQAQFDVEKQRFEIERAKQQEAISSLKLDRQKAENTILWGVIGGLLLLGLLSWFLVRSAQRNRIRAASLEQQELRLQTIIETQEEERARIAKDLHDGIGQQLSGLKLSLSALAGQLPEGDEQQKLTYLTDILDESCSEVRQLSHQMMPRGLALAGLVPAVEDLLHKSLTHTEIEFDLDAPEQRFRFDPEAELAAYRVVQELLNNVLRHANATRLLVRIEHEQQQLSIEVRDNGTGMPAQQHSKGHGLANMRARLRSYSGRLEYRQPASGKPGTIAVATLRTGKAVAQENGSTL